MENKLIQGSETNTKFTGPGIKHASKFTQNIFSFIRLLGKGIPGPQFRKKLLWTFASIVSRFLAVLLLEYWTQMRSGYLKLILKVFLKAGMESTKTAPTQQFLMKVITNWSTGYFTVKTTPNIFTEKRDVFPKTHHFFKKCISAAKPIYFHNFPCVFLFLFKI